MLTAILTLLGLGGAGGFIALLVLRPMLRASLGGLIKGLPRGVWYALAAALVLLGAWWWHAHAVSSARAAGEAAGRAAADKDWNAAFDTMKAAADQWKRNYQASSAQLARTIGERHVQEIATNAAAADDLRLRGPGKAAACRGPGGDPGLAARTGRSDPAGPPGDAAPGGVPAPDRPTDWAVVPWGWLVNEAEEKDALRSEVTGWRSWYDGQGRLHRDAVARLRGQFPEPQLSAADAAAAPP